MRPHDARTARARERVLSESPRLTTLVVGAGPAGLLFVIVSRLLAQKAGVADAWRVRLFDKRESYARTHRLRLDPAPYLAIARELADPRFDAIVTLLRESGFTPEVNVLEGALSTLASELGVKKEQREIRERADLLALRGEVEGEATIVGADSVHSVVRELVRGDVRPTHVTHERLARLRVRGDSLPATLGLRERVRISKVLGSIVDYRLNRNGYAEVDLFLTDAEHAAIGDAAVSLPFFRGMASLPSCAFALARAHVDLALPESADDGEAFRARHRAPIVGVRPLRGRSSRCARRARTARRPT